MGTKLLTSWNEHDAALSELLRIASSEIRVFDDNLHGLKFEQPEFATRLREFLGASRANRLEIIVNDAEPLRRNSPRVMKLLSAYSTAVTIVERPAHLARLTDSMLIVDKGNALIRFHQNNVRSKLILDDAAECRLYLQRFGEILEEGGERVSPTVLGL